MAKFNAVVRYKRNDHLYTVYIRVTHHRKIGYIKTDYVVDKKGVGKNNIVTDPYVLQHCTHLITSYVEQLNKVDITMWDVSDIIKHVTENNVNLCFSDYARKYHDRLYNCGQERNARNYELAYQHLERYAGTTKVMFSDLTSSFICGWIKSLANTARAKEMYPVCIRQIFRDALDVYNDYDEGIIRITTNPWRKVSIPKADTPEKRAITLEECRQFFSASLPESDRINPLPELGRDVALMTLCLAGINSVDLYNLKKENYHDGIICYERAKTRKARTDNAYIEMRVPDMLKPVFEKYLDKSDSEYLLTFHERMSSSDSFGANVNAGIRKICTDSLGMVKGKDKLYCVYTFRHTWATVAQNDCGASLSEVGFAMNHSDHNRVTRGYVKIDFTPAWVLNEKVVDKIFFTEDKSSEQSESQEEAECFERFSFKQLVRGTVFFRGKILAKIEDIGFNNVDEVINVLMKQLPDTMPSRTMVQIRIENVDKQQKKDYTRMIK